MTDFAALFDLHVYRKEDGREAFTLRCTPHERAEAYSQFVMYFRHWYRFTMGQAITRRLVDDWHMTCNRIIDLHLSRKPKTREPS